MLTFIREEKEKLLSVVLKNKNGKTKVVKSTPKTEVKKSLGANFEVISNEDKQALRIFFFSSRRRHTRSLCDWSSECALPIFTPILVITKVDLQDPAEFLANFAGLELRVIRSRSDEFPVEELTELMQGHTTVA